jgi:hypothetical protein
MQRKPFTLIAAVIFALMAVAHLYRLAVGFDITIGSSAVPLTVSWVALVITSGLSAMLFSEARR